MQDCKVTLKKSIFLKLSTSVCRVQLCKGNLQAITPKINTQVLRSITCGTKQMNYLGVCLLFLSN